MSSRKKPSPNSFGSNNPAPPENFRDSINNLSLNDSNIKSYLFYLNKWTNDIQQKKPLNTENLNKYVDIAFAFLRDLRKYPKLRQFEFKYDDTILTTSDVINKIKETNKFIIDNFYTSEVRNQHKFIEMNSNLNSGNFRGGKKKKTNKRITNKRNNKKINKTYKKRRINKIKL